MGKQYTLKAVRFFFFLVCEQLLKGIVYTLAVKSTQVLDLAHQKERVALVWLDPVHSLYRRAFIISFYKEFQNSV